MRRLREFLLARKLKAVLKKSVSDDSIPSNDLLAISDILDKYEVGKGGSSPDIEAAWDRFVKENLRPTAGSPSAEPAQSSIHRQRRIYRKCAALAVCIAVVFSMIVTAQAFGVDIIGTIVRWTSDVFHYEIVDRSVNGFEGTHFEDFDFADGELPEEFIPGWIPEGFQKTNSKYFSEPGLESILAEYTGENDGFFSIVLSKYDSAGPLSNDTFEKQAPDVETYVCKNREFVIARNGESDFWKAAWSDSPLLFQMEGNISQEELIKILNSMGGTL